MITKKDAERIATALNDGLEQFNDILIGMQSRIEKLEECTGDYLKTCPFCKSCEISYHKVSDGKSRYQCDDCLCLGPVGDDEESARRLWNERS